MEKITLTIPGKRTEEIKEQILTVPPVRDTESKEVDPPPSKRLEVFSGEHHKGIVGRIERKRHKDPSKRTIIWARISFKHPHKSHYITIVLTEKKQPNINDLGLFPYALVKFKVDTDPRGYFTPKNVELLEDTVNPYKHILEILRNMTKSQPEEESLTAMGLKFFEEGERNVYLNKEKTELKSEEEIAVFLANKVIKKKNKILVGITTGANPTFLFE